MLNPLYVNCSLLGVAAFLFINLLVFMHFAYAMPLLKRILFMGFECISTIIAILMTVQIPLHYFLGN